MIFVEVENNERGLSQLSVGTLLSHGGELYGNKNAAGWHLAVNLLHIFWIIFFSSRDGAPNSPLNLDQTGWTSQCSTDLPTKRPDGNIALVEPKNPVTNLFTTTTSSLSSKTILKTKLSNRTFLRSHSKRTIDKFWQTNSLFNL